MTSVNIADMVYKGSRNYVHGSDIIHCIYSSLKKEGIHDPADLHIVFRKPLISQPDLIFSCDSVFTKSDCASIKFWFCVHTKKGNGYLLESGRPVTTRKEDNEILIKTKSLLDLRNKSISIFDVTNISGSELILEMGKHLLQSVYPELSRKLYYRRVRLVKPIYNIESNSFITVKLTRTFNKRLFEAEILVNNQFNGVLIGALK